MNNSISDNNNEFLSQFVEPKHFKITSLSEDLSNINILNNSNKYYLLQCDYDMKWDGITNVFHLLEDYLL